MKRVAKTNFDWVAMQVVLISPLVVAIIVNLQKTRVPYTFVHEFMGIVCFSCGWINHGQLE